MADIIPDKWSQVIFGDVVNLSRAKTKDPVDDGIERFIGLEHIEADDLKVRTWGNTTDGTTFTNLCTPGQILFGKRRPYLRKLAVADFPAVCSGDIYIFEPLNEAIDEGYLAYLCFSTLLNMIQTSAGSLSPRTNWKHLSKYEFALPPIDVQKRIVKVIEAVTSYLETLNLFRATEKNHKKEIFSSLIKIQKPEPKYVELGEIAELRIGKTPPRKEKQYWTEDLSRPFCTIKDMQSKWISPKVEGVTKLAEDEGKARRIPAGSLVMSFN